MRSKLAVMLVVAIASTFGAVSPALASSPLPPPAFIMVHKAPRWVLPAKVDVHSNRTSSSPVIGSAKAGKKVIETKVVDGSWSKVRLGSTTGWVPTSSLSLVKPGWYSAVSGLKVRAKASTKARSLGKLSLGAKVAVRSVSTAWTEVVYRGKTGWVPNATLVSFNPKKLARSSVYLQRVAAKYAVKVKFTNASGCGNLARHSSILGCFGQDGHGVIRVSTAAKAYTSSTRSSVRKTARDVVLHETAHAMIDRTCGTARPTIAGARYENVTDAYAYRYLGATSKHPGNYGYTSADARIAKAIHAGRCTK